MALTLILGASGAGKTEWMYQKALETADRRKKATVLFIVPEQFSLQTMEDLIVRSTSKSMSNIEVLSFLRLSYRVFAELSVSTGELLTDIGKSLILKRVLEQTADKLRLFASNRKKAGFLDELKSLISEFYQYEITPEMLEEMAEREETDPVLKKKLSELSLLLSEFQKRTEGKYCPTETVSDRLAEVIGESALMKECYVFLDGYTGFTPSQYSLLSRLLSGARETYLTLTTEAEALSEQAEYGLFALTQRTKRTVIGLAENVNCPVSELLLEKCKRTPGLDALERGIFRYPAPKPVSCNGEVLLYEKKNRDEEAAFVAADIAKRVRNGRLHYRDFAVITGDLEDYKDRIAGECEKAGIPVFADCAENITHNALFELIRAVLKNAAQNFSYDSIFRYLKNPLTDYTVEETSELENYCLGCGIRGESGWRREWNYRYRTNRELPLTKINALRARVHEELAEVSAHLNGICSVEERTRILYEFLDRTDVENKLREIANRYEQQGQTAEASEYSKLFTFVTDLFDRFVELLGTEEMPLSEYMDLLETGFSKCSLGRIPQGSDVVVIGDLTRTRLSKIKVLYLVGANEGVTPPAIGSGGLISETERDYLKGKQLFLAPGEKEALYTEQLYLYSVLTKPQNGLILTYSRVSADGTALQPSWFLSKIGAVFTDFSVQKEEEFGTGQILQNDQGRRFLLEGLREFAAGTEPKSSAFWELFSRMFRDNPNEARSLLRTAFYGNTAGKLTGETAQRLYGALLLGSVSRLEKYASCAFAHFALYGLSLEERAEYRVNAPDMGTLYHAALEIFTRKLREDGISWHALTPELEEKYCEAALGEAAEGFENGVFFGNKRNGYLLVRARRILTRAIERLQKQMTGSRFEPEHCEQIFEQTSRFLSLNGKIDRYDLCNEDGVWYLRVMDYKSGNVTLDLAKLYYGLQVQLEVYLSAAQRQTQKERGVIPEPAGMFYFPLADPFIPRDEKDAKKVSDSLLPQGMLNSDPKAVAVLDTSLADGTGSLKPDTVSKLLPAATDKAGKLKGKQTADREAFELVTEYVYSKLDEEAKEIFDGNIAEAPFVMAKENACKYCTLHSICGFDGRLPEYKARKIPAMKTEEAMEAIREKLRPTEEQSLSPEMENGKEATENG